MARAIALGKNAMGTAAPNPMVGCCIVYNGAIIGEGFTSPFGGPHAEVNAIKSVKNKDLLPLSTLYVTLEPCSHYGKTPPCADFILDKGIKSVVIGISDPNRKVAGKGIERLRRNGVQVTLGVMDKACREHHKRFLSFQEKNRPYIILKWAESQDGFLAPSNNKRTSPPQPYWISNSSSQQLVHRWRSEEMAILVGTQTVLDDNPKLDVRHWKGTSPTRVVIDRDLKISDRYHVMDERQNTIVLTEFDKPNHGNTIFEPIRFNEPLAPQICAVLYKHEIISVIVEGGARTLMTFIDEGLWDEARIFRGPVYFNEGLKAPQLSGKHRQTQQILNDTLTLIYHD